MAVHISEPNGIRDKGLLRSLQRCDWAVRRNGSYRDTPDAGRAKSSTSTSRPIWVWPASASEDRQNQPRVLRLAIKINFW